MNLSLPQRCVAEAELCGGRPPVQDFENEIARADRRFEEAWLGMLLIQIQQRIRSEGCADDVRLATRHEFKSCLPGKVVAPAGIPRVFRTQREEPVSHSNQVFLAIQHSGARQFQK